MMKKMKILALVMIVVGVSQNLFSQTISVSSPGYSSRDATDNIVNVRTSTEVTIVASLAGGATSTYWTSNPNIAIVSTNNQATVVFDGVEVDIYVYFMNGGTLVATKWVRLLPNNDVATGLLGQQNVQECENSTLSFVATDPYQIGFEYEWQIWNGSWVAVTSTSNYSSVSSVLNFQVNSSSVGKKFRAMVKNPNCLGGIDYTGEVVIMTAYPLPANQVLVINGTSTNSDATIERGLCIDPTSVGLQNTQTQTTCRLENVNGTLLQALPGTGGPITFSLTLVSGERYRVVIISDHNCSITVKKR